jgi:hypothetical protein
MLGNIIDVLTIASLAFMFIAGGRFLWEWRQDQKRRMR